MLDTMLDDRIHIGGRFSFTLQRTLRIPDDGRTYPLPPGFGPFPVYRVSEYSDHVPAQWRELGGYFIPMYQREALWLQFEAAWWKPNAVKVSLGNINAISGQPMDDALQSDPQDYLVCPDQPWLDGIHVGEAMIRQFVAMPLGQGDTIEEQLTGAASLGGIQVQVYEPRPGRFADEPPPEGDLRFEMALEEPVAGMGLAAGGRIRQKIYPDPYGIDTWDQQNFGRVMIHIVNSAQFEAITGRQPPPSPIVPKLYTDMRLPWFALYDEHRGDIAVPERLKGVQSIREREQKGGEPAAQEDQSLDIDPSQVIGLKSPDHEP